MKFRKLGKSGMHVSVISFGTMAYGGAQYNFTENPVSKQDALKCLEKACDLEINYIDCADIYGAYGQAERIIGEFIQEHDRSNFVISSKVMFPMSANANDRGLSKKHIHESINKTLERLKTDYLDLYYCHRYDFATPLEETISAMNDLIDQGKILHWATSNWRAVQLERTFGITSRLGLNPPVCDQTKYNMFQRYAVEIELPYTADYHGLGVVAYRILAEALLTGKYEDIKLEKLSKEDERYFSGYLEKDPLIPDKIRQLSEAAQELEITLPQLVHAWSMQIPYIDTVLMSTRNPDRIEENVQAIDIKLKPEICEKIESILDNKPTPIRRGITESFVDFNNFVLQNPKAEIGKFPPDPQTF
ncbi:MAG: aldo/keto reductase [Candidatus Heimdallarchaeota archaeon]|nr:MAG: aldo/keto reductase [Candidatus Heimdallarchaeota archaeon]